MPASVKKTVEVMTAAVRSSTSAARRSPTRRRGRGGHADDLDALLAEAIELAPRAVELGVGGDDSLPLQQRQRREKAEEQVVRARGEGHARLGIAARDAADEEPREPCAHARRAREGALPLLVDEQRCVFERRHLSREAAVRPRLVRVAGEE